MIQNNSDLYDVVEQLSRRLEERGEHRLATELREAMVISSLPGEVLGEIRLTLNRVRRAETLRLPEVQAAVNEAIDYISRALDA